jgi:ppGpp synthetase/RelA/SpoT-type nucleotidyltranferase
MLDPRGKMPLEAILSEYRGARSDYELLADYLKKRLESIAGTLGIYPIIMGRAKSLDSFAEKIQRAGKEYRDPLREMTDLCGVRVIVHTLDQVNAMAAKVDKEFLVDLLNSEDKLEKLAFTQFGYLSRHFIIQLKEVPEIPGCSEERRRGLKELKAELQLRTLAQHLWADVYHELGYKNEFQLPGRWEREFSRLAALLEDCDKGFQDIKNAMGVYQSTYGNYMTQEQLQALAERLEAVLAVDPENVRAMHRLIRAYLSIDGAEGKLSDSVQRFRNKLERYAPALRDIGVAYTQISRKQPTSQEFCDGQGFLKKAVALDPQDVDARCSLGGSYRKQGNREEALRCYRDAYHLDSSNPYPLGNYIMELLLEKGDAEAIHYFRPQIHAAAERCARQIEVRVNLPWAYFDLGLFHLYLGNPHAALCSYAKGIDVASHIFMVDTAAKAIASLKEKGVPLDGIEWLDKLLCIGWWVRANADERRKSIGMVPQASVRFPPPVLLLAGGCDGLDDAAKYRLDVMCRELQGVKGTLVSGGTRSGIAAVPGDLQARADAAGGTVAQGGGEQLHTVGYLPAAEAERVRGQIDTRYRQLRHTSGEDFSPLDALTFWEDYLASGGEPAAVKLLGFNGGRIAACEFRIALAFGARVGIVAGSGRAADELLIDPVWKDHLRLEVLHHEGDDVAKFLRS